MKTIDVYKITFETYDRKWTRVTTQFNWVPDKITEVMMGWCDTDHSKNQARQWRANGVGELGGGSAHPPDLYVEVGIQY